MTLLCVISFSSCDGPEDCIKEKYESHSYGGFLGFGKKNDAPKDIDEALYNFDFETARSYLGCYAKYYDKIYYKKIYDSDDDRPTIYGGYLIKVNTAEINYFLKKGMLERAENVIKEYGDYGNLFEKLLYPKLVEAKEYEKICQYLIQFNYTTLYFYNNESGGYVDGSTKYKKEISYLHEKLNNLINQAIVEKDKTWAKRWLSMYKDDIDVAKSKKLKDVYYKKSNEYLNAVQKVKAAGLY